MKKIISTFLAITMFVACFGTNIVFADTPQPSVSVVGQYDDNGYYFLEINFQNTPDQLEDLKLGIAEDKLYPMDRFDQFSYCDIYNKMKKEGDTKTIYVCLSKSEAETVYVSYQDKGSEKVSANAVVSSSILTVENELDWTGYDATSSGSATTKIEANLAIADTITEISDVLAKYNALKGNEVSFNSSSGMDYRYPAVVLYENLAGNFVGNLDEEMLKTLLFTAFNDSLYFGEPLSNTVSLLEKYNYETFNSLSKNQKLIAATTLRLYNGYTSDSDARDEIDPFITMDGFYDIYDAAYSSATSATDEAINGFNDGTDTVNIGESKQIELPSIGDDEKIIFDSTNITRLRAGSGDIINDGIIYGLEDGWGKIVYVKVSTAEGEKGKILSYSVIPIYSSDLDLAVASSYRQEAGRINMMIVTFPKEMDVTPIPPDGTAGGDIWKLDQLATALTIGDNSIDLSSEQGSVEWITTQVAKLIFPETDIEVGETIKLDFVDTIQLKEDSDMTIGSRILETEPTVVDSISPVGKIVTKKGDVNELEAIFNELIPDEIKAGMLSDTLTKITLYDENGGVKEDCTSKAENTLNWSKRDGRDVMTIGFSDNVVVGATDYFKINYTDYIKDYSGNSIDTKPKAIAIGGGMSDPVNSFSLGKGTVAILDSIRETAGGKTPKVVVTSSSSYGYQDSEDYYMSVELQAAYGFALMGMEPVMGGITVDTYDDTARIAQTVKAFEDCTGMFGPGGDQAMNSYSYLKPDGSDTEQMRAMRQIFYSGGVISGSSAGDHSLSNPMLNGGDSSSAVKYNRIEFSTVDDYEAVPTDNVPMFTPGFGFLQNYGLTDSHVNARGRLGRIIVALKHLPEEVALLSPSGIEVTSGITKGIGIGVDEDTAFTVIDGIGEVSGTSGVMISDISEATFPDTDMFTVNNVRVSYLTAGDKYNFNTKEVISNKSAVIPTASTLTPSTNIFPDSLEASKVSGPEVLMRNLIKSTSASNYGEDVNNDSIVLTFNKDEMTKGYYSSDEAFTVSDMQLNIALKASNSGSGSSSGSHRKATTSGKIAIKDAAGNILSTVALSQLEPKNGAIEINITEKSDSYALAFNLGSLNALEAESKGGKFTIDMNGFKYNLPFDIGNEELSAYIKANKLDSNNLTFNLVVSPLAGDALNKAQEKNKTAYANAKAVSDFYNIKLELLKNGTKLDVDTNLFIESASFTIPTTEKGNAVFLYDPQTGKFSFVPATFTQNSAQVKTAHHSIYVVAKNNNAFSDVQDRKWYTSAIVEASNKGLVSGVGNNKFNPTGTVTRAQFVQMIATAMQLTDAKDGTAAYSDVSESAWYYDAVMKAKSAALLDKFTGEFKPNDPITREEMAVILAAVVKNKEVTATDEIADLSSVFGDYNEFNKNNIKDIELVYSLKIMQGTGKKFEPQGVSTRAQATTVQLNLLKVLNLID